MYRRSEKEEGVPNIHLSRYDRLPIWPSGMLPEMGPDYELEQSTIRRGLMR